MKYILYIIALLIFSFINLAQGQNGYVKLSNDSIVSGYIQYDYSPIYPEKGKRIKVFRHKMDKQPIFFYENEIQEHALKKDTVIVLAHMEVQNIYGENTYYQILPVRLIERGKILTLHSVYLYLSKSQIGSGSINYMQSGGTTIYIIEHNDTKDRKPIRMTKSELATDLSNFIKDNDILNKIYSHKIKYHEIPELIKAYNEK